jgi:hypothetical protein
MVPSTPQRYNSDIEHELISRVNANQVPFCGSKHISPMAAETLCLCTSFFFWKNAEKWTFCRRRSGLTGLSMEEALGVVITGAAGGVGWAYANEFMKRGYASFDHGS